MGDMKEYFQDWKSYFKQQKEKYGVKCPDCIKREPKRNPTILLPGQRCYCGYKDKRKRLEDGKQ